MTAAGGGDAAAPGYVHPPPAVHLVAQALAGGDGRPPADLATCYEVCRRLSAAHGRTYYLATRLLPRARRHHVHALYAFARYADDLVDHLELSWSPARRRAALEAWSAELLAGITGRRAPTDPVQRAAAATVAELGIDHGDVRAFLRSMAMDLAVTRYGTFADLEVYMHGSAAVIGTMMLPVLGAQHPHARARARDLGIAFQLTNFLRDVAEDWDRGRIYLPLEDLERFGVTEADFRQRHVGPAFRRLLAFEIARTRALYRRAEAGWAMVAPASRTCVRTAHRLYAGILEAIEDYDYQVFDVRAAVPAWRKLSVVARELVAPTHPVAHIREGCDVP